MADQGSPTGAGSRPTRTLEESLLRAVLDEDEGEAERLASAMLPSELYAFDRTLDRVKEIVDREFWKKKSKLKEG